MKKLRSLPLLLTALLAFLSGCTSNENTVAQESETPSEHRIIATTMSTVEIAEQLDLDLIGVPKTSRTLPERYQDVTEVGSAMSPDLEIIKSLNPTDVLSVTTLESDLASGFTEAGISATFVNLQSIESMQEEIIALGEKYDKQELAEQLANTFTEKIAEVQEQIAGKESPKVLILLGIPGSYLVATDESYIGNLVELAGGTNVIGDQSLEYLASNTEYLYESNPDIILRLSHGMPEQVVEMFNEEFRTNDIWQHFSAVLNDRVYDLEEPVFGTTANIQATTALEELVDIFYGEDAVNE